MCVTLHKLFPTQIVAFIDALTDSVANTINEECGDCGFSTSNLANIAPSCSENRVTYQAKISDWYSMDDSLAELLSVIGRRFNMSADAVVVSTADFAPGSINGTQLSLSPMDVSIQVTTQDGSGDGEESSGGSTTFSGAIPTDEAATTSDEVTTGAGFGASPVNGAWLQTRPLSIVTVTMVAMATGTFLFGL